MMRALYLNGCTATVHRFGQYGLYSLLQRHLQRRLEPKGPFAASCVYNTHILWLCLCCWNATVEAMQSSRFGSINPRAAGSVTSRGQCSWVSRACYETRRQSSSLPRLASSLARGYVYDVRRLQRMKTSDNLDKRGSASSLDELTEFRRRDVKAGVLRARSSPSSPGDSGRTDVGIRDPVQRACECVNSLRSTTNLQQKKKGRLEWLPSLTATALMSAAALCVLCLPGSALALEIRTEPANALSLPTWAIHVSSVLEWVTAMVLFWRLAEASGTSCVNPSYQYLPSAHTMIESLA